MVYDEGFEITLNSKKHKKIIQKKYFAFSKYKLKDGYEASNGDAFKLDPDKRKYTSICNETFLGWVFV